MLIGLVERMGALGQSVVVVYMARFRFRPGRFGEYCHIASRRPSDGKDRRDEQARLVYGLHKEHPARRLHNLRPLYGDEARLWLTRKLHKLRRVQLCQERVIWETPGICVSIHKQKIISAFADKWPRSVAGHAHFAYGMSEFASLIKLPCVAAYNV